MGFKLTNAIEVRGGDAADLEKSNLEGQKDQGDHNAALSIDYKTYDSDDVETYQTYVDSVKTCGEGQKRKLESCEEIHHTKQENTKKVFTEGADIERHNVSVARAEGNYAQYAETLRSISEARESVYKAEEQITEAVIIDGKTKVQTTIAGYK